MSYTFGGTTGDDIAIGTGAVAQNGVQSLVMGWWYPTTLTTGRFLWGSGTGGARIGSTTSELKFQITHATTSGVRATQNLGLVVDQWQFLAFLMSPVNGGPDALRIWKGTTDIAPTEVSLTVSITAAGNATTSATSTTLGNQGASTAVAFQGDIGSTLFVRYNAASASFPFTITTTGTITDDQSRNVLERLVLPFWRGDVCPRQLRVRAGPEAGTFTATFAPLDTVQARALALGSGTGDVGSGEYSQTNATVSFMRAPRDYSSYNFCQPTNDLVLRRR